MRAFIYDHELPAPLDADYYASFDYIDGSRSENKNYAYLNDYLEDLDFFKLATDDLFEFSNCSYWGKNLRELISFEGVSLWWFYEIAMKIVWFRYLKYQNMLACFLKRDEISSISCDISDPVILSAVKDYCSEMNIPFERAASMNSKRSVGRYDEYFRYGLNYLVDVLISKLYNKKVKSKILIASYTNYWTRYNITKDMPMDGIFHDIQDRLQECDMDYIGLEYNNESLGEYVKTRLAKRKYDKGHWIPLNAYTTLRSVLRSLEIYKNVNHGLSTVSFEGNTNKFLGGLLRRHIKTSFFLISEIQSLINAVSLIKPEVILTSCEYCKMGRAAVIVGNGNDLMTVALQHGLITSSHWGYIFSSFEKVSVEKAIDARPLPRYTLVYGPGYKELLTRESTYPSQSLVVTGQPRYDHLYRIAQSMDKWQFLKEHNLKMPLIVWLSQHGLSPNEIRRNIASFLQLLEKMPDMMLFIKPHPGETDLSIYEPLMRRNNVVLSKEINLYKLINVCCLVITKTSTTAMEAAALKKPVIILNLSGEPDAVDYVKEGIALGVYREEDLSSAIGGLLKDDSVLAAKRERYLEKYLYKIDGKSSQRVVETLVELLDKATAGAK